MLTQHAQFCKTGTLSQHLVTLSLSAPPPSTSPPTLWGHLMFILL